MSLPKDKAWFPTKTYGYGWGLPTRWQGWVVLTGYSLTLTIGAVLFAARNLPLFISFAVGSSAVLMAFCFWKGEAPRWRWGGK